MGVALTQLVGLLALCGIALLAGAPQKTLLLRCGFFFHRPRTPGVIRHGCLICLIAAATFADIFRVARCTAGGGNNRRGGVAVGMTIRRVLPVQHILHGLLALGFQIVQILDGIAKGGSFAGASDLPEEEIIQAVQLHLPGGKCLAHIFRCLTGGSLTHGSAEYAECLRAFPDAESRCGIRYGGLAQREAKLQTLQTVDKQLALGNSQDQLLLSGIGDNQFHIVAQCNGIFPSANHGRSAGQGHDFVAGTKGGLLLNGIDDSFSLHIDGALQCGKTGDIHRSDIKPPADIAHAQNAQCRDQHDHGNHDQIGNLFLFHTASSRNCCLCCKKTQKSICQKGTDRWHICNANCMNVPIQKRGWADQSPAGNRKAKKSCSRSLISPFRSEGRVPALRR